MSLRIKKCSSFLITTEFKRINKRIKLLTENFEESDASMNPKEEVIKNAVDSIENINNETDEKKKEILDDLRVKKISAQSEEEYEEWEQQESNFIEDIDLEGEKKAADIVWEFIPKNTDPVEVNKEKVDTTLTVFDYLSQNAKKFFLVTCIGLLGWNVASTLFSKKQDAKKFLDKIKISGFNFDREIGKENPINVIKFGEIGAGGSIGEIPEPEPEKDTLTGGDGDKKLSAIEKKIELAKKRITENFKKKTKKTAKFLDPSTLKVTDYFDKSTTVFTSAAFPYKVNNKYNIDKNFEDDRRKDIKSRYIPTLDRVGAKEKTGLKLLALAMTYMEGYMKGTLSYQTNNPGNVLNTDSGRKNYLKSLDLGVKLQLELLKDIAAGKDPNYPFGGVAAREPYWSPDPNLRKWIPGMVFYCDGTLEQFLRLYATGCRNDNNYLNVVLSFFEVYFPGKVTKDTLLKDIILLGDGGKISVLIIKNKKQEQEKEEKEKKEKEKKK